MMRGNVRRKKKSSSLSIKIKPFTKPPTLPANFYPSSSAILFSSLHAILHRQSTLSMSTSLSLSNSGRDSPTTTTTTAGVNDNEMQMEMPSREELYGKVQDLCTHGFGPKLYKELIEVLDQSAFQCATRLTQHQNHDQHGAAAVYPTMNCHLDLPSGFNTDPTDRNGGHANRIYFSSLQEERPASEGSIVLQNSWAVYDDYIQFLNCVRNIFLSLDRLCLYLPPGKGQAQGKVLSRNASRSTSANSDGAKLVTKEIKTDSSSDFENAGFVDSNATAGAAWDMWDVGMDCLYKHFAMTGATATSAVASAIAATTTDMECSSTNGTEDSSQGKYSILQTLKVRTIQCIIAELDLLRSNNDISSSIGATAHSKDVKMGNENSGMLHKSLVRNCVSIFRALSHVSNHNLEKNDNVRKDLLRDLVKEMTAYFQNESQTWMSDAEITTTLPSKTSYNACLLLHHIDDRMKQVASMTSYYHLAVDTSSDRIISALQRKSQNRLLIHLVEEFLLTPHFTPQLLLHPTNLYPILDQKEEFNHKDAQLLFQLSKCYAEKEMKTKFHTDMNMNTINTITTSQGMELLRQAFEVYGKERGISITRPTQTLPVPISVGPVKPPPQMTVREINNTIIINLLEYKAHLEFLHKESFGSDVFFGKTVRRVLESVLNDGGVDENETVSEARRRGRYGNESDGGKRIAELLAKYMDLRFKNAKSSLVSSPMKGISRRSFDALKSLSSGGGDNDTEVFQTAVLDLFRHIQSKDIFEAFYRQDLSKRLLLNKSSSIDAERSFVSKLKAECGTGYTSKMEGMFKDMELSKDILSNYSAHLSGMEKSPNATVASSSTRKVDMDVQVLTTGYWPAHPQYPDLVLPQELLDKREEFDTYYRSKYQGRRIVWQNGLGNCIVRASFPKIDGPRELNVSLCQALVFLCFNLEGISDEESQLNIGEIMKQTGISDRGEAERVLQSLSMGRVGTQVLCRVDSTIEKNASDTTMSMSRKKHKTVRKAVSDSDLFQFNSNFTSNQRRIRITNIQMKETPNDRRKTHESVILDRLHLIDAAIVRIMKARKTLQHRDLVGEVMNQLKFPAKGLDVKKRIESLIEREYLERVEGDSSRYNYLA
eukprot:scaffold3111_cov263-Chaetoceros_neogracile.AAC.8